MIKNCFVFSILVSIDWSVHANQNWFSKNISTEGERITYYSCFHHGWLPELKLLWHSWSPEHSLFSLCMCCIAWSSLTASSFLELCLLCPLAPAPTLAPGHSARTHTDTALLRMNVLKYSCTSLSCTCEPRAAPLLVTRLVSCIEQTATSYQVSWRMSFSLEVVVT